MYVALDGFRIVQFIDHLYTRLLSTSNVSGTAIFQSSQIATAPAKTFPACCVLRRPAPNFQLRSSRRLFSARPFGPSQGQFQAYPDDLATHGPARSRGRRRGVPDPRDVFPRPRDTVGRSKRQWS
jgi:hypothetical protein